MEYRPLEITLVSAEGLKNVNTFGKMNVYAVVFLYGDSKSKKVTRVCKNCGTNPSWNEKIQFAIDERAFSNPRMTLVIKLKADKSFFPNKTIGEVAIPISELFKSVDGSPAAEKVVEYQVTTSFRKPKGTLKFSYKLGDKISYAQGQGQGQVGAVTNNYDEPVTAYPPAGYDNQGQGYAQPPPPGYGPPPAAPMAYPAHPGMGYQQPPPPAGYPGGYFQQPPPPAGYPPQGGYQYPPAGYGYGYAPPAPAGYGYQQPPMHKQKPKKSGMGMGMGIGAGLLGGLLIGDMVSDVGEMAAYNEGYGDAMGDFDF